MLLVLVSVSVLFSRSMCLNYIMLGVGSYVLPPFGKELLIRRLLCIFISLAIFHFGSKDKAFVLLAPVPGYCLLFTFHIGHLDVHCI